MMQYIHRSIRNRPGITLLWAGFLLAVLAGCLPTEIQFEQPGTARLVVGEVFSNPARSGVPAHYESNRPEVARVDSNGTVTALAPGRAVISASNRDDFAQYPVEVINRNVSLSAWVGEDSAQLFASEGLDGVELLSSSDPDCDFNIINRCADNQRRFVHQTALAGGGLSLSQPQFYQLRYGERQLNLGLNAREFSARFNHQVAVFQGQLWLVDARLHDDRTAYSDLWSSRDGTTWVHRGSQAFPEGGIGSGPDNHLRVFNDELWLINTYTVEAWSSPNGVDWTAQSMNLPFDSRTDSQVVVFPMAGEARLWVIGGESNIDNGDGTSTTEYTNTVWTSADGRQWTALTQAAPFPGRRGHQTVAYRNRLWVVGGKVGKSPRTNDVWSSNDGQHWRQEIASAAFSPRYSHSLVVFNDSAADGDEQLWLIGGPRNDVWSSRDGRNWTQHTPSAAFSVTDSIPAVVFNKQLWLIGGFARLYRTNDIWSSRDGEAWKAHTTQAPYTARRLHQVVTFNGRFWLIGGEDGNSGRDDSFVGDDHYRNDIWSSADGLHWVQHSAQADFSARAGHQLVVFRQRLWLIGGESAQGRLNDVWSSADGIHWTQHTQAAEFPARSHHQVVAFQGQLVLVGGRTNPDPYTDRLADVWASTDGVHWERLADGAFPERMGHQLVVFNGQLLLIGGNKNSGFLNDVWSSNDGRRWAERTPAAAFSGRYAHQVVVTQDPQGERLWLMGGGKSFLNEYASRYQDDLWTSRNGIDWTAIDPPRPFGNRGGHQMLAANGHLWLFGGLNTYLDNYPSGIGYLNDVWKSANGTDWQLGLAVSGEFPLR
ncbi:kelch repeat-containing protein [Saccharospirillum mangrovi]|uniref:Kelch repeat-containing protein n=1 Tax=Saccharospirillum mangrovi TaxID=2161747 RepID=UPI000D389E63|nr:kelch repeat-containing protein [Saccharospirillum mangrovi]